MKKAFVLISLLCFSLSLFAQTINANWKQDLQSSLSEFQQCRSNKDNTPCLKYIGNALKTIYKVNDFYTGERYMSVSEISKFLSESKSWSVVGPSNKQETLTKAQQLANEKRAVVAVFLTPSGLGHVVIITPGELEASASWGLQVPKAASFFLPQPDKSFIDRGLSYAFGKNLMDDVLIYSRNY